MCTYAAIVKTIRPALPVVLALAIMAGCAPRKQSPMSDKQLFDRVKVGMSRADTEKILGKALFGDEKQAYYGKGPKIGPMESPPALTSIVITYSAENTVESKNFYGADQ